MMVASPLNRPIRVDGVCITLSFPSPFALALLRCPRRDVPGGDKYSLLAVSSGRFFSQNTVPLLVFLGVYLAP
jgi:hypothetical protein